MNPAEDQYGSKATSVHIGHQTHSHGLPNTGLVLYPVVIVALLLVLTGLILRMRRTQ